MIARELLEGIGGYSGLFFFCAASGIVFPVPEDLALMYAGMRIEGGALAWLPTMLVAVGGVLVRDAVAYGIGRGLGDFLLDHAFVRRILGGRRLDRARRLVDERGSRAVMVGRFLVGLRAPVFMACGASRVPFLRFLAWDLLGLCVAVPVAIVLGYVFGAPLLDGLFWFIALIRPYALLLFALAIAGVLGWLVSHGETDEP
ncbi:MAG: DedA family protein [Deltaproteobacteria bacterium]|nr:MAG: DedA family protein [Deltaproteobacteria bacterium]